MATTPSAAKKARLSTPRTPHASSDDLESMNMDFDGIPKFSAVPLRISQGPMTPSTSTVAFSSSPRRDFLGLSSSPTRPRPAYKSSKVKSSDDIDHDLVLSEGTTLIFGRHRHSHSSSTSFTTLSSAVPKHMIHLLAHPENDASVIPLSKTASHASRVHAAIELDKSASSSTGEEVVRILVIGQNGMRVRIQGKRKGVRLVQGQQYELALAKGQAGELDFFGCKALVRTHEVEWERERLFSSSPVRAPAMYNSSMPPSSPPMMGLGFDEGVSELEFGQSQARSPSVSIPKLGESSRSSPAVQSAAEVEEDRQSRQSSPLSPASEARRSPLPDLEPLTPVSPISQLPGSQHVTEPNEKSIKLERMDAAAAVPKPLSRAASPALPVPAEVDLAAIIASTVVFSGSSKLSLPDLVKHMLESQPSLKEHGPESRWSTWVSTELESNKMFGKVERHGKDASGHPLLPHYFYNPAEDPDASRATELGALVRPLRTAQRTGGKVIDWRPVGRGRRS
ncbi:hypothetical protein I317_01715 [Kwoniella heveanensis CBS 569]|nr:hypothetical protein I317_01715 [Kwoniella heveanensis CBS 569]